jgi:hypothetical protein
MQCKIFIGQGPELEEKINQWLTMSIEIVQVAQSSLNVQGNAKVTPFTIITIFYRERNVGVERVVE